MEDLIVVPILIVFSSTLQFFVQLTFLQKDSVYYGTMVF